MKKKIKIIVAKKIFNTLNPSQAFQFFQLARYSALFIAGILITKSRLSQQDIGNYETFLLMSSVASFFWVNALLNIFITYYNKTEKKETLIWNTGLLLILISLSLSAIAVIFRQQILQFFSLDPVYFYPVLFFFIFNTISFLTEYVFLARKSVKGLIFLGLYHIIFQTACIALPALFYNSLHLVFNGLVIFVAIKFILFAALTFSKKTEAADISLMKAQLKLSWPLMVSYFLGGVSVYIDGIIVNKYFDKSAFATYQYGAKEFPVLLLLTNAFSVSMINVAAHNFSDGVNSVRAGSLKLMHRLFPLSVILMLTSKYLFPVVFNPDFSNSFIYFNIYLLLLIPRVVFPQPLLTAMHKTKVQLHASAIEFAINVAASMLLLYFIGLAGIAIGTLLAYLTEKLILVAKLKKEGTALGDYTPIKYFIIYSILLILAFCISTVSYIHK